MTTIRRFLRFSFPLGFLITASTLVSSMPGSAAEEEMRRWTHQAQAVRIVRDDWGIAHESGRTDADVVFGMIYAQAEDDFNRIENNYLTALGRSAEAYGESRVFRDLRMRMLIHPDRLKELYAGSPAWLRVLMDAWAGGLNYYLARHPEVKPRVLGRFEPWMALSFTEGSIGGDVERIDLARLAAFYGGTPEQQTALVQEAAETPVEPTGSNGIAIAPSKTAHRRALLLINPHTSFYFRSELQMTSDEGLNTYGAVTWGQFFIYQGFNDRAGWMHTSSGVDAVDEYLETVTPHAGGYVYTHGGRQRPVIAEPITIACRKGESMVQKTFTVYRTHHGPVVRSEQGKWVSIQLMHRPIQALEESYLRTKAKTYRAYRRTMELKANSSNNTIYADADGNIAYFHGNFLPRREDRRDWTRPVDGSDTSTDWRGLHAVRETPLLLNPASGWLYNVNNWPWSAAGDSSPVRKQYPSYAETGFCETARGIHAQRLLTGRTDFTRESLLAAAYDRDLPFFERTVPVLVRAWENAAPEDRDRVRLAEPIRLLRDWDYRWSTNSIPTALAVFWGEEVMRRWEQAAERAGVSPEDYVMAHGPQPRLLSALGAAVDRLEVDFGTWKVPWGAINRFQRITGDIVHPFSDQADSLPVGFTSGTWGSLAAFEARPHQSRKWYGTSGNSFVAVVEFGKDRVRALAVTAGGESGSPRSPHFNDQAGRYVAGDLREVYFYPDQLRGHTEREYHPGE